MQQLIRLKDRTLKGKDIWPGLLYGRKQFSLAGARIAIGPIRD